jgi:hypothetical protein
MSEPHIVSGPCELVNGNEWVVFQNPGSVIPPPGTKWNVPEGFSAVRIKPAPSPPAQPTSGAGELLADEIAGEACRCRREIGPDSKAAVKFDGWADRIRELTPTAAAPAESGLLSKVIDQFMKDCLVAIAGAVATPEKGYLEDGGLSQLLADIKRLRKQHDTARERIAELGREREVLQPGMYLSPEKYRELAEGLERRISKEANELRQQLTTALAAKQAAEQERDEERQQAVTIAGQRNELQVQLSDMDYARQRDAEELRAAEQREHGLREALEKSLAVWKEADEQRLKEHYEVEAEANKWKAEGDMYGWNFHMGRAGGMTQASIIFYRVLKSLEKALSPAPQAPSQEVGHG